MKELIEEKKFEMRAYDKVELALLYCPDVRQSQLLKHWWDGSSNASRWCWRWAASDIMCGGTVSCVRRWNRLSVIWASLEKRENEVLYLCCCSYVYFRFPVYHSADCCTSLSLFMYMSFFFPVLDGGSFSTSFPWFKYLYFSVLVQPLLLSCTCFRYVSELCRYFDVRFLYQFIGRFPLLPLPTAT